jgi:NADH:ubiquinone oxidoreductase subunit K
MDRAHKKSIFAQYPAQSLMVAALVIGLIGVVFMLTVVGVIVGAPLLLIAAILGMLGTHKYRSNRRADHASS